VVPVGDSFLYFEPWYLKSTTSNQSLSELKKVILVARDRLRLRGLSEHARPGPGPVGGPAGGEPLPPGLGSAGLTGTEHSAGCGRAHRPGALALQRRPRRLSGHLAARFPDRVLASFPLSR
jgi:hypothetical protein